MSNFEMSIKNRKVMGVLVNFLRAKSLIKSSEEAIKVQKRSLQNRKEYKLLIRKF